MQVHTCTHPVLYTLPALSLMFWWCLRQKAGAIPPSPFHFCRCQWCCFLWMRFRVEWKAEGLQSLPLKTPVAFRSRTTRGKWRKTRLACAHGLPGQWEVSMEDAVTAWLECQVLDSRAVELRWETGLKVREKEVSTACWTQRAQRPKLHGKVKLQIAV